jgi:hypothetical protein
MQKLQLTRRLDVPDGGRCCNAQYTKVVCSWLRQQLVINIGGFRVNMIQIMHHSSSAASQVLLLLHPS